MTEDHTTPNPDAEFDADVEENDTVEPADHTPPQYGVGPFSIREVVLAGIWALAFLFSFFSIYQYLFESVWTAGLLWVLTIGVPTVAVFLLVLRRLSPGGIRRVGSLGIDQFASVAFSVSAVVWLQMVWDSVATLADNGDTPYAWVPWVELVLMTAGVVFTVFAPILPTFREDFQHRPETVAHRSARSLRPVTARPVTARPVKSRPERPAAAPAATTAAAQGAYPGPDATARSADVLAAPVAEQENVTASYDTGEFRPFGDAFVETGAQQRIDPDPEPLTVPAAQQPFWALAPVEREVLDERGAPLFVVGPTAWALVIEDRGEVFVVRHEDGRIGYLHDVTDITRG